MSSKLVLSKQPGHGLFMRVKEEKAENRKEAINQPTAAQNDTQSFLAKHELSILRKHVKTLEEKCSELTVDVVQQAALKERAESEALRSRAEMRAALHEKNAALDTVESLTAQLQESEDHVSELHRQTRSIPALQDDIRRLESLIKKERITVESHRQKEQDWKYEIEQLVTENAAMQESLEALQKMIDALKAEGQKLTELYEQEQRENLKKQEIIFDYEKKRAVMGYLDSARMRPTKPPMVLPDTIRTPKPLHEDSNHYESYDETPHNTHNTSQLSSSARRSTGYETSRNSQPRKNKTNLTRLSLDSAMDRTPVANECSRKGLLGFGNHRKFSKPQTAPTSILDDSLDSERSQFHESRIPSRQSKKRSPEEEEEILAIRSLK